MRIKLSAILRLPEPPGDIHSLRSGRCAESPGYRAVGDKSS